MSNVYCLQYYSVIKGANNSSPSTEINRYKIIHVYFRGRKDGTLTFCWDLRVVRDVWCVKCRQRSAVIRSFTVNLMVLLSKHITLRQFLYLVAVFLNVVIDWSASAVHRKSMASMTRELVEENTCSDTAAEQNTQSSYTSEHYLK